MKVTVIGSVHLSGVSTKTNKPYNFGELHYKYPSRDKRFHGECVAIQKVYSKDDLDLLDMLQPGDSVSLEFDDKGFVGLFPD